MKQRSLISGTFRTFPTKRQNNSGLSYTNKNFRNRFVSNNPRKMIKRWKAAYTRIIWGVNHLKGAHLSSTNRVR